MRFKEFINEIKKPPAALLKKKKKEAAEWSLETNTGESILAWDGKQFTIAADSTGRDIIARFKDGKEI